MSLVPFNDIPTQIRCQCRRYKIRVLKLLLSNLGIPKNLVPIVPVHSSSAFLARNKALTIPSTIRTTLYGISRFRALERCLIKEVKTFGELYRIRSPYDTLILFSRDVGLRFRSFGDVMRRQRESFETNVKRFSEVASGLRDRNRQILQKTFKRYFQKKRDAVTSVVDDLFEAGKDEAKQKQILQEFMPEQQVQQKVDHAHSEIRNHIQNEIADFFLSFRQQLQAIAVESQKADVGKMASVDMSNARGVGETADLLKGLGVASSVVSGVVGTLAATSFLGPVGTVFWVGSANIWNPVGWGLMLVGIGLGVFGLFKSNEAKQKIQQAKNEAANKLKQTVDLTERNINDGLEAWVEATITKLRKEHIEVMSEYAQYTGKHLKEIAALTGFLDTLISDMQKAKYQSMIRRFKGSDTLIVEDVVEGCEGVTITLSENIRQVCQVEKALSRIEEKTVVVVGSSACRN